MKIQSINPATGAVAYCFDSIQKEALNQSLTQCGIAFLNWQKTTLTEREKLILSVAQVLESNKKKYAQIMTDEMGKLTPGGIAEVEKCSLLCRYFAEHAATMLADREVKTEALKSYYTYNPLGVVLAIMPWNYPFWQVFRCAVPAILAGNTVALRHSLLVPACAVEIEKIFMEAGAPQGVFKTILADNEMTEACISHPSVKAVSFTGSTEVGKMVASLSGKYIKKQVLELGGSDAYVILKDADIAQAVQIGVTSRTLNSGQSCIAAKRFIVVHEIYKTFLAQFVEKMKSLKLGAPQEDGIDIGPLVSTHHRERLHRQVLGSIEMGAHLDLGGELPSGVGAYYPATVISSVTPGMPAFDEELFGPVAAIIEAKDEQDAIRLANKSSYGLGAAIFSKNVEHANQIAKNDIHAGAVFVNDFVRSDPRLPFGGVNQSGYGRELSEVGIHEFCNIKTVYVRG